MGEDVLMNFHRERNWIRSVVSSCTVGTTDGKKKKGFDKVVLLSAESKTETNTVVVWGILNIPQSSCVEGLCSAVGPLRGDWSMSS